MFYVRPAAIQRKLFDKKTNTCSMKKHSPEASTEFLKSKNLKIMKRNFLQKSSTAILCFLYLHSI